MYQGERSNRGSYYRKTETAGQELAQSCLGRLIMLAAVAAVVMAIAYVTVPSDRTMRKEMDDNLRQCIEANDSIAGDWLDNAVSNIGYIFTSAEGTMSKEIANDFKKYNRVEFYRHSFHASVRLYNNVKPEGTRVGIGIFGIVIPTVNFNDFLLHVATLNTNYGGKLIKDELPIDDSYMGETPTMKPYHYKGNPED